MAIATSTALALAAAAAASAASAYNTSRVAKKQDRITAQGIRKQGETQREANAKLQKTLAFAEKSRAEPYGKAANENYTDAVRRTLAKANAGLQPSGGRVAAFDEAAGTAANDTAAYGDQFAGLLSRMDAPQLQRQAEQFTYGNLGIDLDVLGRNSAQDDFLTRLRASGVRRNPYVDFAAGALGGYASGMPKG